MEEGVEKGLRRPLKNDCDLLAVETTSAEPNIRQETFGIGAAYGLLARIVLSQIDEQRKCEILWMIKSWRDNLALFSLEQSALSWKSP